MAAVVRKRPCRFCRRWFVPYARQAGRQYACSDAGCQSQRQAANQRGWLAEHPGYFRGRGVKHRQWRAEHAAAKRDWRRANPEVRERERLARSRRRQVQATRRAVEEEALALQLLGGARFEAGHARAVEQESLMTQLRVLVGLASALPPAVAQEPMAGALSGWEARGRRLLAGAPHA